MIKEIIAKIEEKEKLASQKIENERKICEKNIYRTKIEAKEKLESTIKQNNLTYKESIDCFLQEIKEKEKDIEKLISLEILELEEKFKNNKKLATKTVIESFLNCQKTQFEGNI